MPDKKKQIDKFKEVARKIECDDDETRFAERLGKLVQRDANKNNDKEKPGKV